jgi:hypothetical protein
LEGRLNKRTRQVMYKANTWISQEELEAVNNIKGDITISLFLKRLIRKALAEERRERENAPSGLQVSSQNPQTAAPEVVNTTATPQGTNQEEAEAF